MDMRLEVFWEELRRLVPTDRFDFILSVVEGEVEGNRLTLVAENRTTRSLIDVGLRRQIEEAMQAATFTEVVIRSRRSETLDPFWDVLRRRMKSDVFADTCEGARLERRENAVVLTVDRDEARHLLEARYPSALDEAAESVGA